MQHQLPHARQLDERSSWQHHPWCNSDLDISLYGCNTSQHLKRAAGCSCFEQHAALLTPASRGPYTSVDAALCAERSRLTLHRWT
jgi:hypothetical protein